jgi:hypothetical protein
MQPAFNPPQGGYEAELLCPKCKSNYLHHHRVEIFERTEDADQGIHLIVQDGSVSTDTSMVGNPSSCRHGLMIHFECEMCHAQSALSLAQHKGNTHVSFVGKGET